MIKTLWCKLTHFASEEEWRIWDLPNGGSKRALIFRRCLICKRDLP